MMIGRFFINSPSKKRWVVVHYGFYRRFTMGTVVGSTAEKQE